MRLTHDHDLWKGVVLLCLIVRFIYAFDKPKFWHEQPFEHFITLSFRSCHAISLAWRPLASISLLCLTPKWDCFHFRYLFLKNLGWIFSCRLSSTMFFNAFWERHVEIQSVIKDVPNNAGGGRARPHPLAMHFCSLSWICKVLAFLMFLSCLWLIS